MATGWASTSTDPLFNVENDDKSNDKAWNFRGPSSGWVKKKVKAYDFRLMTGGLSMNQYELFSCENQRVPGC